MNVGLTYVDENGKIVYSNSQAVELLDFDRDSLLGDSVMACHPEKLHTVVEKRLHNLKRSRRADWHRLIERKGHFLESYYSSVFIDNCYKGIVIATRDVTERENLSRALRKSFDEMSVLFDAAQLVNSTLNIRQVLASIVALARQVVGFDAGGILLYDRATRELLYDEIYNYLPDEVNALKQCAPFQELQEVLDKDYIIKPVENHFTCSLISKIEMAVPMVVNNDVYGIWFVENHQCDSFSADRRKMLITLANLTSSALKNAWMYERTFFRATVDQLTGLYNRQYFEHVLDMEKEKARLVRAPLSLIMADVNRLKYINDTFGHEMGDYVIREAASVLKKSLRRGELVFRFGGDEMIILLPGSDRRQTYAVVRRIRANLESWNRVNRDSRLFLHMSIGCCTARDADTLEKLVRLADEDMYRDKAEYYKLHGLTRGMTGPR